MFARMGHCMRVFNPIADPTTNILLYQNKLHNETFKIL